MNPETGMYLVLGAGTLTFGNDWWQTKSINWRVPVATVLAAAAVAGIGHLSPEGGAALGVMALLAAAVTPLQGKSPIQTLNGIINGSSASSTSSGTVGVSPSLGRLNAA